MVPATLQHDLGEDVVAQVAQRSAGGVGQLGAAQVDLVVRHHPDELTCKAEGLGRRGGRRSRVVRCVRKLLAQLQVVQNEPVAVIGDVWSRARVSALAQQRPVQRAERGVDPVEVVRGQETVGQPDLVDGQPGVALQVQ